MAEIMHADCEGSSFQVFAVHVLSYEENNETRLDILIFR
jgi:hypothetical protein